MQHPPETAHILLAATSLETRSKAALSEQVTALAPRTKREAVAQAEYKRPRNGDES